MEEMEELEDEEALGDRHGDNGTLLGSEQIIDGVRVVRSHTGDYSRLKSKASEYFSFKRLDRIRWKDAIYGGLNSVCFLYNDSNGFLDGGVEDVNGSDEDDELQAEGGGLLKRARKSNEFKDREDGYNFLTPISANTVRSIDWADDEQRALIRNCFVTSQEDSQFYDSDGDELDENDVFDAEDNLKMEIDESEDGKNLQDDNNDKAERSKRLEAKAKLKARFDAEYDETNEYYNTLKEELDAQAKVSERLDTLRRRSGLFR